MLNIFEHLSLMEKYGASDLYLTVGKPATWRGEGAMKEGEYKLNDVAIWEMARAVITEKDEDKLQEDKELNVAYVDKIGNRFRINVFFQQQCIGMVIRSVAGKVPSAEELNLPEIYTDLINLRNGLVLIVGTAGCGKSTSIAAMLDHRNKERGGHVITVEDPIEYVHKPNKCIFTQREVGIDTHTWDDALKNALRQRPDIIYIGEIRDANTMKHAMNFAETGHLCIATLHSTTADKTIERIVNFFPIAEKSQNLYSLAQNLKAVIAQRMVPTLEEGKNALAIEILKNEGLVKPYIVEGKLDEIHELMEKNSDIGMRTFDQSLLQLHKDGIISKEAAIYASDNPGGLQMDIVKHRANMSGSSSDTGF